MRASWSFRCEPLNRVAELSRSWPWFPSDPPRRTSANARGVGGGAAGRVEGRVSRGRGPDARRARERESGEGRGRGARAGDPTEKMVGSRTSLSPPLPPPSPPLPEPPEFMGSSPPRRFASSSILSAARGGSWVGHERGAAGIDRPPARGPPHADARKKRPRGAKKRRGWHEKPPRGDARFGGRVGRVSARVPDCLPVRITPRGTNARGKDSPRGRSRFADSPVGRDRPSRDECWKSRRRARRTLRAAQISARGSGAIGSVEERLTRRAKPSRNPSS